MTLKYFSEPLSELIDQNFEKVTREEQNAISGSFVKPIEANTSNWPVKSTDKSLLFKELIQPVKSEADQKKQAKESLKKQQQQPEEDLDNLWKTDESSEESGGKDNK